MRRFRRPAERAMVGEQLEVAELAQGGEHEGKIGAVYGKSNMDWMGRWAGLLAGHGHRFQQSVISGDLR
jgi:hypothetical protein